MTVSKKKRDSHQRHDAIRACDTCKEKKSRCSGTLPCTRCCRLAIQCEYKSSYSRGLATPLPHPLDPSRSHPLNSSDLPAYASRSMALSRKLKLMVLTVLRRGRHLGSPSSIGSASTSKETYWHRINLQCLHFPPHQTPRSRTHHPCSGLVTSHIPRTM